ncbi:MAG: amino acid adenylation domain-containing protein, partial [Enterobacteriaceae bacterium]|nr:amino acid adenylation domain-containing protein [Enterobacteriaceae bacterium]
MPMTRDHNNHEARPLYENTSVSACCTFSLSSPQQVIWLDQILRPENTCYNIGSVIHVEGELDETLLIRAVKAVVARHDALRLRLVNTQELPQQTVADTLPVTINIHDFSAYPDQEKRAEQHFHAVLTRPFDLNSGGLESKTSDNGLWRFELLRMGNQRWYWQFCSHHLIGDGTMLGLITEDITNTYSQLVRGEEITEPAPSYLDFVAEDVAYLDSARYRQDRQFWLERYENFPPPLLQPAPSLSSSSSLSHGASTTGKTAEPQHPEPVIHQFDSLFFQQIEALATAQGLSVLHFMYAVLACYFFRTTSFSRTDNDADSTEIVFGIPVHNRKNAKQKHTVGMFASVIPVGITLAADDTFLDIMHKAATELRRCYKHQRLPIAEINRHIQARQKTGQAQLFDIMLSYEQIEVNAEMPDATLSYTKIQRGAPFPLGIVIHKSVFTTNRKDSQKPTRLEFDYSPDYLNRAEVLTLQARLLTLAQAALFSPQQRVRDLPLSSPAEQQALVDFNASQMAFPQTPDTLVHSLFEQQAALHPDAIAVEFAEQTLSYGELNRRANRLAHHLIALGVRPDERVAICVERSPEMIVGLLAILKAGGAYVPLDPAYPAERLNFMLKDSAPVALLTQRALAQPLNAALPAAGHATLLLDAVFPDTDAAELAEQPAHNPEVQGLAAHHLAYVIYTSGSTGLPKGVEMPLAALSNLLLWHRHSPEKLTDTGKTLQFAALGFDVAFQEIFTTLCEGGCLVLINEAMRREPQQFLKRVQQQQIERLFLPYIALQHLAEADSHHHPNEENDLSCLKHIITAGEQLRMTPAITQLLQRAKNCRLHNHYGPTESHVVTAYTLEKAPEHWPVLPPIGRPIANTRIYILDAYGQPVPPGVTGEIYIAGKCVARGYLNRPELTAERFLPDPFCSETNSKMYKTGDLGRWLTDGNIDYLGRNDFQIKLRGFRIEPGEIEAKLMLCHGVREAAVIVREDEPNQKRLVAYVCPLEKHSQEQRPQDDITLLPAALRAQLSTQLAEYMLPSAFVILDTLPLTPNGKLDRKALPAPDLSAVVARSYVAPVGETETMLAQIWQGLLGLERVGRHDHFFELGGHSLLAVQLAARVRQIMGRELPLRRLFAQPVLMDLAQVITATEAITQAVIPLADRSQPLPLSFAQQRLWFLNQLDPASSLAYHIPVALQLHGQLDRHALTTALDSLVARHESLRTRLVLSTPVLSTPVLNKRVVNTSVVNKSVLEKTVSGAGQPCQAIDPADTGFTLSSHDLRPLDPVLHSARITELTEREARTAFDFAQSPLIRGHLLQLADEAHLLLLTVHHIIADGWSIGIFVRELGTLYHAILTGDDAPLPPLPVQYADYALWQREWLQNNLLTEQQDFWRSRLQDAPALLSLPTDSPRPAVQTYVGSQVPFLLDKSVVTALKTLGKQHDTTLFMTLLAGWSIVLARLSGQDDIVIGTPVANRPLPEFEGLIGFFVNTLALRISVNDDLSVAGLLAQVREQALAAYAHQDLPFEQVVEALQPERSLSYSPIFQVMLALDNTPVQAQTSADLQISRLDLASRSAHFDLLLLLTETDDGLTGGLEYAADLFDAATAERMVGYLVNILTAMTADAAEVVTRLPMLPASERQQLLVDFNATQTDFTALGRPQNALIHQLFERQAALCPAATAVIGGDQMLTYDELNRDANRLAHHLIALGIQPDDRVAICVERSPAMIVGLLGILKAGGAYVPLDPAYPADRLSFMLEDAAPAVILTQTSLSLDKQLADTLLTGKLTRTVPMVAIDNLLASTNLSLAALNNPDPQALGLNDRHLAYIIYTSGSTGLPKGVAIEHRNTVNFLNWAQTAFNPAELAHTLFATSLNFDLAVYECFAPLLSGGTVHLVPDVLSLLQPEFTGQTISLINTVPSAIARLAETHAVPDTVQTINLAGEALKSHLAEQLLARTNIQSVCNLYGPSETTTYSTWTRMDRATGFQRHIGRPIANTRIYILDPHGQPVPLGVSGEIYIAGNGVARGYLNRPELTAERFLPDPFFSESDGKMYQTGDLGRWLPDGNIEYLGRNDFQVKIRGFRIELGEIEARLMQ